MQTPVASDPSFKAFLEKLQEQNNRGFVTQLVQLKAERENAGEDNDKREKQLDDVITSLKDVRSAVTGIKIDMDLTPLVNIGENQTKLLDEIFKESSLTRKLTEGSVEYSKEMAGYRNTSGRDVTNEVSGKVSKTGQVIDFETARDALSAQGKRAKEANAFDLKPINYTPGKTVAAAVSGKGGPATDTKEEDKSKYQGFFNEIKSGFKFFMTDGLSEKPGHGIFQTPSKDVESKDKEPKVSSPIQENPEADNVASTGEIEADAAKSDLEVSKQMLDTTKAQLVELKAIREALAPKTPKDLPKQKSTPTPSPGGGGDGGGGGGLLGGLGGMMPGMGGVGKGLMAAGKAALPWAAAAGVAVAGGAAVDYGLGKLGVGKDKEGNDLKVDTAQDDANWAKMSMGQKIQSGLARGIEKTGSALFLGNLSKEAQASRIKKETDYLNKNTPGAATKEALAPTPTTVKDQVPATVPTEGESLGAYSLRVSKSHADKKRAKEEKYDAELVEGLQAQRDRVAKRGPVTDSPQSAIAHKNVLASLDKNIEDKKSKPREEQVTGGPGAKDPVAAVTPTTAALPVVEKKPVDTAAPGKAAGAAMGAAAIPSTSTDKGAPGTEARINFIKKLRQQAGDEALKAMEAAIQGGKDPKAQGDLVDIGYTAIEKYGTNVGGDLNPQSIEGIVKSAAMQALRNSEKKKSVPVVEKKDGDLAAPGAAASVAMGAAPATVQQKEEKVTGGPGAKDPVAAVTTASAALPVVEKKPVDTAAPGAVAAVAMGAAAPVAVKKEAGPNWKATLNDYKSSTPVDGLESQYPGIKAKYVELANNSTPRTDNRQSIETHEEVLKTKALRELTGGKSSTSAKPGSTTPTDAAATPALEKKPIETALGKAVASTLGAEPEVIKEASLGERVKSEATRLGIEPGKGKGIFEGGVLTKMVDTNTGKEHNIEISEKDKRNVDVAREMSAKNENSGRLAAAASRNMGSDVNRTSTENVDMGRETNKGGSNNTVVSNNVSSNNTTKIVPMKANPRPEYTGSSLDRYTNRITVY